MIPFDIEKWKAGWKPVDKQRNEVYGLTKLGNTWKYLCNNRTYFVENLEDNIFLLPPDDIVVEVTELVYGAQRVSLIGKEGEVPPGRYKLVKID